MTKHDYDSNVYVGKHEMHEYKVWRVLGPAGPEETTFVTGKKELMEAVAGMWDYEVEDLTTGDKDVDVRLTMLLCTPRKDVYL